MATFIGKWRNGTFPLQPNNNHRRERKKGRCMSEALPRAQIPWTSKCALSERYQTRPFSISGKSDRDAFPRGEYAHPPYFSGKSTRISSLMGRPSKGRGAPLLGSHRPQSSIQKYGRLQVFAFITVTAICIPQYTGIHPGKLEETIRD